MGWKQFKALNDSMEKNKDTLNNCTSNKMIIFFGFSTTITDLSKIRL